MTFLRQPEAHEIDISSEEVLAALQLVLRSQQFVCSQRLSSFLRFAVEQTLAGKQDALKEYTIGTEVYNRKHHFDPTQDSIVRTEARRLRRKLKEYYENEGARDDVVIFFRTGSYVPAFRTRDSLNGGTYPRTGSRSSISPKEDVCIAVSTFQAPHADSRASTCALAVTDEIAYLFSQNGISVVCFPTGVVRLTPDIRQVNSVHPRLIISGTARTEAGCLHLFVRATSVDGLLFWTIRCENPLVGTDSSQFEKSVAENVLARLSREESRRFDMSVSGQLPQHSHPVSA